MNDSPVWAVVVARTGPTAKRRLAGVLGVQERTRLAVWMLGEVLRAVREAGLAGPVVVTDDALVTERLRHQRVRVLVDSGQDMNAAVEAGVREAMVAGADAVVVLPGDVPFADPADLRRLVSHADDGSRLVVVVPDEHGTGTNALLLRPPDVLAPAFGLGSAVRHLDRARQAGACSSLLALPSLALDVDVPLDLQRVPHLTPPFAATPV